MKQAMTETELKFIVPEDRVAAVSAAMEAAGCKTANLESRYYDTEDRRLADAGLSLRLRNTGARWEQTLKAPGASAIERLEETVPLSGEWGLEGPAIHPALHANSEAGDCLVAALAPELLESAPFRCVHCSVIERRTIEVEALGARVEVAFDLGSINAGGQSLRVAEVEYELKEGEPGALLAFGRIGVLEHGMWLSTLSKAARGERLARAAVDRATVKARPPRLQRTMSGEALFRAVLLACLDPLLINLSTLAGGDVDDERVHQLRVGIRRLRTASRELGFLSASFDRRWEPAVTAVFHGLGEYRDRETVAASMREPLAAAGSPEPTLSAPPGERPDPVALVKGRDFQCALLDLIGHSLGRDASTAAAQTMEVNAKPMPAGAAAKVAGDDLALLIAARLARLHRRLAVGAKHFEALDDDQRHRVRRRLKRLRYLAELVAPLYKAARVRRFLDQLKPAQDALGGYIDIVVAMAMARQAAERGDAPAWFNAGWLAAQMPASLAGCGRALRLACKSKPFWKTS